MSTTQQLQTFNGQPPQQQLFPPTPHESQIHVLELGDEAQPHARPEEVVSEPFTPPAPLNHHQQPEWISLVMSFSLTAMSTAFQSIRAPNDFPLSFHLAGLGLVFALAAFVLSKYIPAFLRREAQLLEHTGVFFGITAFLLEITFFFPLCLKFISWFVYATALLALILFPLLGDRMQA